jgi:CheY-like chemotaxis protein
MNIFFKAVNNTKNNNCNIALIDDDRLILKLVKKSIEREIKDCNIDTYLDPKYALENMVKMYKSGEKTYNLAIVDWMMPSMSGEILTFLLKQNIPSLKVILFTGSANDVFLKKMFIYNVDSVVTKDSDLRCLIEKTKDLVS